MRKFPIAAIAAFGLVLFAGTQVAVAQETETVKTTVAFPFMVGKVLLPAGTYEVVPDQLEPSILEIRSVRGSQSAFATIMATQRSDRRGDCLFQFVNVGGRYYLTKIDDGTGDLSNITLPEPVLRAVNAVGKTPAAQK